ncbi:MAG: glycosyltransferase family 2 protein [Erysipelotrichaceae bacterium]
MVDSKKRKDSKVSIIVPVYNTEQYIKKTLVSILNQSYSNIEVVVIDDGCTDSTMEKIVPLLKDERLKVISQPNGGLVSAVNKGIENATGEYITFVDADDQVGMNFIQAFAENIEDFDVIACGFYIKMNDKEIPFELNDAVFFDDEIKLLQTRLLTYGGIGTTSKEIFISRCNKMYKLEVVKKIYPQLLLNQEKVRMGEDVLFTYLILNVITSVKVVSNIKEYYYNRNNPKSLTKDTNQIKSYVESCDSTFERFMEILEKDKNNIELAYMVYYRLLDLMIRNLYAQSIFDVCYLYKEVRNKPHYHNTINLMIKNTKNIRQKFRMIIIKYILPICSFFVLFINKNKEEGGC